MTKGNRIFIYPKDIARITGKTDRYGRKVINQIRLNLGKEKHQHITVQEYSEWAKVDPQNVFSAIP